MRAVVQRVSQGQVTVENEVVGAIRSGLLVLVGVGHDDTTKSAETLASKVLNLRIFEDDDGKMNRSLIDTGGALLAVSQFTLYGDCRKGRRPSFVAAGRPELAEPLFDHFVSTVQKAGVQCETGRFRTTMQVSLSNEGPITLLIDTDKTF